MKKYIVLSVNDNVDYLYFTPLTCWAWRQFGWEPIVMYHGKFIDNPIIDLVNEVNDGNFGRHELWCRINTIEGYRSDTITQISRLYAGCLSSNHDPANYLMTGDIDMLPLSDYWKPSNHSEPTVWGHDLTGFGHYPICYIGMSDSVWRDVMNIHSSGGYNDHIKRDLDTLPQAKDPDFYKYWFSDQDLITERLKQYGTGKIDFINRGQGTHGYARGRVDRGNGGWVLEQPELIDAHLEQQTWQNPAKVQRLYDLLAKVWPGEDFTWFKNYTEEFKKLAV